MKWVARPPSKYHDIREHRTQRGISLKLTLIQFCPTCCPSVRQSCFHKTYTYSVWPQFRLKRTPRFQTSVCHSKSATDNHSSCHEEWRWSDHSPTIPASQERRMFTTRHGVSLWGKLLLYWARVYAEMLINLWKLLAVCSKRLATDLNLSHTNQIPSFYSPFSYYSSIRAFLTHCMRSTCLGTAPG